MFSRVEAPGKRVETVSGNEKQMRRSTTRGDSYLNQSELLLERMKKIFFEILLRGTHGVIVFISFPKPP